MFTLWKKNEEVSDAVFETKNSKSIKLLLRGITN